MDLVIFDCDGVLVDSEIISARMLRAEAASHGVDISIDHILDNYVGRSYPTVLAEIQAQFAIKLPDDFEDRYRALLLAAFEKDLQIMPDVCDVIARLNTPFCVATSSTPKRVAYSLKLVGLAEAFHGRIFTASQVALGKPAPDLFLLAAQTMGVAPQDCLVIEDSTLGVQAGNAAHMQTARFTGGSHIRDKTNAAGAGIVFDTFADFYTRFPQLEKGQRR